MFTPNELLYNGIIRITSVVGNAVQLSDETTQFVILNVTMPDRKKKTSKELPLFAFYSQARLTNSRGITLK